MGVDRDGALGSAVWDADRRTLPGHQHGQRLDQVEIDVGVVADAALGRPAADVVLHAPPGVDLDRAVIPADREVNGELPLDVAQAASRVVRETDHVCGGIEPPLRRLEGRRARFHRHLREFDSNSLPENCRR